MIEEEKKEESEKVNIEMQTFLKCGRFIKRDVSSKADEAEDLIESMIKEVTREGSSWFYFAGNPESGQSCLIQINEISHVMIEIKKPKPIIVPEGTIPIETK